MNQIKEKICQQIDSMAEELNGVKQYLFDTPEIAYQEYKSCEYLKKYMAGQGFQVEDNPAGIETAFVAKPQNAAPARPAVAFLAEYDALPGIGHGCGHNLIAAASVGATLGLLRAVPELAGGITLVGTPAEEGGGGKVFLDRGGVFKDMDAAMMFHPSTKNYAGKDMLGRIKFYIKFHGQTSHAAGTPDKGINALDAMVMTYCSISALRQQMSPAGRIHGIITKGGEAPNIIPDYAEGLYYVRGETREYRDEMFEKVKKCAEGAALATGCSYEIEVVKPAIDPFNHNYSLEGVVKDNLGLLGIEPDPDDGRKGSSDIGNLSWSLPCIHPMMAIADTSVVGHTVEFGQATMSQQGDKALLDAAKMLAMTAHDFLTSSELREKVKKEFEASK
jgi:amidohydrolase